jgi:hypothetical protein
MGAIYLVNILYEILIYSKYTSSVTIILMPFMLIITLEYICNMVVDIHSLYTFVNLNVPNYIPWNTQNTPLYIYRPAIKLVTLPTNGT